MKLSQNGYLRKPDEVLLVVNVTDLKINYLFKKNQRYLSADSSNFDQFSAESGNPDNQFACFVRLKREIICLFDAAF